MRIIVLTLLFIVGCAKPKQSTLDVSIQNSTITPFITNFYNKAVANNFDPKHFAQIKLGYDFNNGSFFDNNSTTIAICKVEDNKGFIAINPNYWANFQDLDKSILLYHELSHCLLGRGHTDMSAKQDIATDKRTLARVPTSIMYPIHLGLFFQNNEYEWLSAKLDSYYLPELFGSGAISAFSTMASSYSQTFVISEQGCDHQIEDVNESQ